MSSNETDGGVKPPSGFTFADKRKVNRDATAKPVSPEQAEAESALEAELRAEPAEADGSEQAEATTSEPVTSEPVSSEPVSSEPAMSEPAMSEAATSEPELAAGEVLAAERLADLQRLQAEYANYRKRVDRDRALAREQTVASVVESLLPVLDDIQLARQHGDLESGPFASIAEKLENALFKYGVERYGEPGAPFDPAIHDALMHVEEELAEGTEGTTVVGILQPGYRIGDRVIRPARVSVADPS